jgi:hypothetical protein
MNNTFDDNINHEVNKILINEWQFLNNNWPIIHSKYKHRTEIKGIEFINEIKMELKNKIGYVAVFFFFLLCFMVFVNIQDHIVN